jgi:penicillin amidase
MKKVLGRIAMLLLLLAAFLVLGVLWYRQASLPQVEGQAQAPGLRQAVDVVRDKEGIPHIFAANARDAWFSLGYVHAQDRLWQMEINRRIAAGRMAEILGPKALPTDRFLRTLGVRRNAERVWSNLDADSKAVLTAYADGVNAYLSSRKQILPPEFLLTGASAPEPWTPIDSLSWQTMMAWDLGANWTQEILRMRLSQRLSLEQINAFLPPYPGDAPLPTRDYTVLYRELQASVENLRQVMAAAPPSGIEGVGSNNWVVDGAHAKSGKPLLANDPHLSLTTPALWYFAHIAAPGMEMVGATLPGLPGVVLGRNRRIAWGFTNTAPDVQDLFIERVRPGASNQYQTPDGWANFEEREEILRVKGQPDVKMKVRESRHGPIITGALPVLENSGIDNNQYAVAFSWTALRPDDKTFRAGLRIGLAQDWNGFVSALRDFHAPQQNMVYADVDGNIGFIAPGRVPLRKAENDLKGLAPAPGWDARYDWDGVIPFEALPRSFNPKSGRIATANEKIVGPDYPYFLTSEWHLPYRAQRIGSLLEAQPLHDAQSFMKMQQDVLSLAAAELLPVLKQTRPGSERARQALQSLANWQGEMNIDSAQALLFNTWTRELAILVFADELGEQLMKDYSEQRNVHAPLRDALLGRNGQQRWCRDTRPEAAPTDCAKLQSQALDAAIQTLEQQYGRDMAQWRWGEAHQARSEHRPFSHVPALAWLFELRLPSAGDTYTVNVGRYNPRDPLHPFENRHAASLRAVYDLASPDATRLMHSTGQSGHPLSTHYRNFSQRWANGEYLSVSMTRAQAEQGGMGVLRLQP